jgi:hypothetical protein
MSKVSIEQLESKLKKAYSAIYAVELHIESVAEGYDQEIDNELYAELLGLVQDACKINSLIRDLSKGLASYSLVHTTIEEELDRGLLTKQSCTPIASMLCRAVNPDNLLTGGY